MTADEPLEDLVRQATGGSRDALNAVVRAVQDDVYGLALRMLWHPQDAADAAQEILIKIVTHLGSFRGESRFRTWCYRIASNHLSGVRASRSERHARSFEALSEQLAVVPEGPASAGQGPEARLLEQEVKVSCTLGILLCLDRPHRLAFIVGDILGLPGEEAAEVSGVPAATYRKRLSRAREKLRGFLAARCGIVNPEASCRCARQVGPALAAGKIAPDRLLFAHHPERPLDARALLAKTRELEDLHASVQLYRSHPDFQAPESVAQAVRELLSTRPPSLLLD
ncbi:MAG: RNA polymerase sigma factor [Polyangiaceae bacterium]|jgi:RNA polymerase sigma factor (sigma-70 family)|nr:RNA polymerase sigma factor [Polyangiaceae bacterium]